MKKIISTVLLFFLIFTLTACSGNTKSQIIVAEAGYTCEGLVKYGENFSSNVTVKSSSSTVTESGKPSSLNATTKE